MAVYTHLTSAEIAALIQRYDVGELRSAKGIAEGVSNSNWLVETEHMGASRRFILTLFESRTETADLPYFLSLLDHLSEKKLPVPRTIHTRDGGQVCNVRGRPVALIEFLPGVSIDTPEGEQASSAGAALANLHLAAADFPQRRDSSLSIPGCVAILRDHAGRFDEIDPNLARIIPDCGASILERWPDSLPQGTVHTDLFPDNVLFVDNAVTGLIDFYFACTGTLAYDFAVMHAAWSFGSEDNLFQPRIAASLFAGYNARRPFTDAERGALPVLAEAACLRFVATRVQDWFAVPEGGMVRRKDPVQFADRLAFYAKSGDAPFR